MSTDSDTGTMPDPSRACSFLWFLLDATVRLLAALGAVHVWDRSDLPEWVAVVAIVAAISLTNAAIFRPRPRPEERAS